jgi:hypothetical protein
MAKQIFGLSSQLYFKIFESVFARETAACVEPLRKSATLLMSEPLHRSLVTCCLEITLFAFQVCAAKWVAAWRGAEFVVLTRTSPDFRMRRSKRCSSRGCLVLRGCAPFSSRRLLRW